MRVRLLRNETADGLGSYSSCAAAARIAACLSGAMFPSPRPLRTRETALRDTPARSATSWDVALREGGRVTASGYRPAPTHHFLAFPPFALSPAASEESAAMKASWGTSTRPTIFMRFFPSFCFSSSFRLRVMSPP